MKHTYSDAITHKRVAIIGPVPPPLGGVSVHVERVMHKLRMQNNTVYHFDSTSEWRYWFHLLYAARLVLFLLFRRPQVVIYHTSYLKHALWDMRIIYMYKELFGCTYITVEHDCRFVEKISSLMQPAWCGIYLRVDKQVFIGTRTQGVFEKHHLAVAQQLSLEAAFLPPDMSKAQQLRALYPASLHDFIQKHRPLIIANAFQLSYYQEKDLYGFDQLVSAVGRMQDAHPHVGLLLLLAQKGDKKLYAQLQQQIARLSMDSNVYILTGNYLLWPLFGMVDLFVRPTLSDGASVSVQEALHCGVPVIASDVCWRPPECVLYKPGDVDQLYHQLQKELYVHSASKRNHLYPQSS